MTRVITFQLAREGSTRTYPQIGVPEPHHPVSHHTNDPEKLAKLAKINAYHVQLFAYLLEKLQSTPDGDGTLLDHSTYVLGSGMGNPDIHDHRNLPIVIARGGIGGIKGGYHVNIRNRRRWRTCTSRCSIAWASTWTASSTARAGQDRLRNRFAVMRGRNRRT